MAIFTAIASFILTGTFVATGFGVSLLAAGIGLATVAGISYIQKSLAGNPNQDSKPAGMQGVQGKLVAAGDVPRSFMLGYSMTAGSLVYANTWGLAIAGATPNAYFTQVIALSDMPCGTLQEVWVNGEKCTASGSDAGIGVPYNSADGKYQISGVDHLFIRYYDGTQTTADSFLVASVSSAQRPYQSTRVGTGVAYVIVTCLVDDTLFTGFPSLKFAVSGMPLYDPTKDSTNGGSGSHRWSTPSTWGGDGDSLPAVQLYNILRGVYYSGTWLYGLQLMTAARLPNVNWNAQIAKCRATITGVSGAEATYRSGGQVNVNVPPIDTAEHLLSACQGRLSEIGGFYKVHLGAPDSSTFSFTDADILSTEEQEFTPFFGLADSINGIISRYPSPAEGWAIKTAPALLNSTYETADGGRRLLASPSLDFVPYDAQVQRLQKSALLEARRARRHSLSMPPMWWIVEPGDFGDWTSVRNGYSSKQFRVDGIVDHANADVTWNITEVDPTDYSWTHATDYRGVTIGPTVFPKPAAQGIIDWAATPYVLYDDSGLGRRAAIRLTWDGTQPGVSGVQWEVRNSAAHPSAPLVVVHRGRTDQVAAGAAIISQNLVSNTAYEVRGQYIPSSPRDMLWSSWLAVTTPNVDSTIDQTIRNQVTLIENYLNDQVAYGMQLISAAASNNMANTWLDNQKIRSDLVATASDTNTKINAHVSTIQTALANSDIAFAGYKVEVASTFGSNFSSSNSVQTAFSTRDVAFASYQSDVAATFGAGFSTVSSVAQAFSTRDTAFSSYQSTVAASFASTNASVTTNASAIATLNGYAAAQYSVTLDVNGYATGFNLFNGGGGVSTFTVTVAKFQIASPGTGGGGAVPIFTVANVGGSPKVAIRGDMYADGTIYAQSLVAGTITSASGVIGALSVDSLSIADNAATVPNAQGFSTTITSTPATLASFTMSIDTTGLSGKTIKIYAIAELIINSFGTGNVCAASLDMNGSTVAATGTGGTSTALIVLTYTLSITGTGGTVNVPIAFNGSVAASSFTCNGTLFAIAAKR